MEKQQTAVEWLVQELFNEGYFPYGVPEDLVKKAKEMEKEQMKLSRVPIAYENKSWQGLMERHFEQWYKETFKSE
jgi:hypothetical protein